MKKVALMTWFQHDNYGTVLQSTALKHVVSKLGYHLDGVDYISEGYNRETKVEKILDYKNVLEKIKNRAIDHKYKLKFNDIEKSRAFDKFRHQHMSMTKRVQTSSELFQLNYEYDAFICGSDQIWTPRAFNSKYYLDFVANEEKMISYAPSFGMSQIDNELLKRRIKEQVSRFKHLSIREEEGAKIIKDLTGIKARVVLDPTLLLDMDEWNSFIVTCKIEQPYILCYLLGRNQSYWKHIYSIAKKYSLQVVIIPIHPQDYHRDGTIKVGTGPGEFLSLVKGAELICTDSFHGTIFSVLYKKSFVSYKRFEDKNKNSQNSRLKNLLIKINLENRLIDSSAMSIDVFKTIDYEKVYSKLEVEKRKSLKYLEESLVLATNIESFSEYDYTITNTCSGCAACYSVCKHDAIIIKNNKSGFYSAIRDISKCVKCGLCRKACAFNGTKGKKIDTNSIPLYMLRSKSEDILATSTSGGAASEISRFLNEKGYDVYGCVYDRNLDIAKHKKVNAYNKSMLASFQGSKYIQSNIKDVLKDIETSNNAVVIGTPCQIAGLDNLLRIKNARENYVLVDLICHGVPTMHLWHKYLREVKTKYDLGNNPDVKFRYKTKGWKPMHMCISGNDKKYLKKHTKDMFYRYFELENCYMPSCYECNFRETSKSDIRIGDYWGKKYDKYKRTGASMVLGISNKGTSILEKLRETNRIMLIEEDCKDYYSIQGGKNPIIPIYYQELIDELANKESTLKILMYKYFRLKDLNKRLSRGYSKIKKLTK